MFIDFVPFFLHDAQTLAQKLKPLVFVDECGQNLLCYLQSNRITSIFILSFLVFGFSNKIKCKQRNEEP